MLEGNTGAAAPVRAAPDSPLAHLGAFAKIKSFYILKKIFYPLEIIKKRLDISIKDYKEYSELIEIEINPVNNKHGRFINIKKGEETYYHIYFDDKEVKRNYINKNEKIKKIKITIDNKIESFENLFLKIKNIEKITKFYF